MPAEAVRAGMDTAASMDRFDPDLVAVEARRSMLVSAAPAPVPLPAGASQAASLGRLAPSLAAYDKLLTEALSSAAVASRESAYASVAVLGSTADKSMPRSVGQ
jgi:hypothetical protein